MITININKIIQIPKKLRLDLKLQKCNTVSTNHLLAVSLPTARSAHYEIMVYGCHLFR